MSAAITRGQIQDMVDESAGNPKVNAAITTAGNGTLTAAGVNGGVITRTGPIAAFTDTFDTAAAIIAAFGSYASGDSPAWELTIINRVAFTGTLAAGVGVTLTGNGTLPPNSTSTFLVTITSPTAVSIVGTGSPMDPFASTAAEIDRVAKASARVVTTTAATLALTAAAHGERIVVLNSTHTQTVTLPAATGTGDVFTVVVGTLGTDGSKVIQVANTTDIIQGQAWVANTQNTTDSWLTSATSDTVTFNNTTQGGTIGSEIILKDVAAGLYLVRVTAGTTGNPVTPFSSSV